MIRLILSVVITAITIALNWEDFNGIKDMSFKFIIVLSIFNVIGYGIGLLMGI